MKRSLSRIYALFLRYLFLHKRSLPRALEMVFWPVMDLLVWGFVTVYIQSLAPGPLARVIVHLINALIFWDILFRSQQGVTISFIEDIWTQNIINLLVSPLRLWEWLTATFIYGMVKTLVITGILAGLALGLYHFNLIGSMGLHLIPLVLNLLLFGWVLGLATSGLVIRWGHSAEALIWGVPFLIQPISAVFYPLSTLPPWLQTVSRCLPTTYVFEGMRALITTGTIPAGHIGMSFALNGIYFLAAALVFRILYLSAYRHGNLGRLGME